MGDQAVRTPPRPIAGHGAPRVRHVRYRALVVENWPKIAERRRLGFPLADLWRELANNGSGGGMTYKAFRTHVHQVAEAMERSPSVARRPIAPSEQAAEPTLPEIAPPVSPPMSQKAKFRAAREAQKQEAAAAPPSPPQRGGKPDTSMIDGGEIWMSVLGRQRVRELAALNLKLRSGEISEADARPALEAARREAWSKRLGVRADQLTEEDMNGHW